MRNIAKILCICLSFGAFAVVAWAVPPMINYQGAIVDSNGIPLNGTITLRFSMWDDSVAGTYLWIEQQDVLVIDGLFDVELGRATPISRTVFDNDSLWLQVQAQGHPAMLPRQRIATVAYAFRSAYADTAAVALSGAGVNYALVYTVALSGGDFGSISDAIAHITGGVGPYLIRVMPGAYAEPDLLIPSNVTLQGAGKDCCFLACAGTISMSQPSAKIAGFDIQTNDPAGINITAADITLGDNSIQNAIGDGVIISGIGLNTIIHDCKIHDCDGWGIRVREAARPFIHDNLIHDNAVGGVSFSEAGGSLSNNKILHNNPCGVEVSGAIAPVYNLTIDGNQIADNFLGLGLRQAWSEVSVIGNDIRDNDNAGIEITDGRPHIAANTITRSITGIVLGNALAQGPAKIVGNNIWLNFQYGIDCPAADGAQGVISSNIIIGNNVRDINYVAGTAALPTFNNNTFNATVTPPGAPGLYNVDSQGTAINP
jgi:parallel beta-helix repeat protein